MAQTRKTTTKRAPAKKTAASPKPAGNTPEPVRINSNDPLPEVEQIPLFYLDDVEYTMPKEVPPYLLFAYLDDVHKLGADTALANAMVGVIGEGAVEVLGTSKAVTKEHVQQIMGIVENTLMSQLGEMTGKSRSERRK